MKLLMALMLKAVPDNLVADRLDSAGILLQLKLILMVQLYY